MENKSSLMRSLLGVFVLGLKATAILTFAIASAVAPMLIVATILSGDLNIQQKLAMSFLFFVSVFHVGVLLDLLKNFCIFDKLLNSARNFPFFT